MTHQLDVARGRDIVGRWCALAEQRLGHLTELFETGRWRRYHSEQAFLENLQEAKAAVELWRDLLRHEISLDRSNTGISWLGRARTTPSLSEILRDQVPRVQSPATPAVEPLPDASTGPDVLDLSAGAAPAAPDPGAAMPEIAPELTPNVVAIHERYPLLRNAL